MAEVATIAIGDVLDGKYEITDILGEGAMGVVYLALHRRLGRMVALKTLRAEIAGDRDLVERFEREARAASAIGHPNIVQVFDAGGPPGLPYLVMENLSGSSLGELLASEGPIDVARAIVICQQVLAGLEAAHGAGIIHRDLKPDNIFVCRDASGKEEVKILDFGISKILAKADPAIMGDGSSTRVGMVMGTPLYMSPEQASGRPDIDHRTDLWALVCVLYECVSGTTPFTGDNYNQILASVLRGEFVSLAKCAPSASVSLSALVDRGLALDKESRFADAASLLEALAAVSTDAQSTDAQSADAQDKMLAAFDNLADRFLEQEATLAPAPAPLSSPASVGRRSAEPPRGDARFAPPTADGPVSLDLDVEITPRSLSRQMPAAPRAQPRKRPSSQIITRDAPTSWAATIGKLVLLLALLAGGSLGYRYYTLGYILAPTQASTASLELVVQPPGAAVYLDGMIQVESRLRLPVDQSYVLRLRADKRLIRQQRFDTRAGAALMVRVRLANEMPSIEDRDVADVAVLKPAEQLASDTTVDAGADKLRAYARCATPLWQDFGAALSKASEAEPLARTLVDECVLALRVTAATEPAMPELDEASLALVAAIADVDKAVRELKNSAGAGSKLLRSRKAFLAKATKDVGTAEAKWAGIESSTQAQWLALELLLVGKSEPDSMHAVLRELAVNSDRWMRAQMAGSDIETFRAATIASYTRAQEAATQDPATYKASGGEAFLRAIKPLTAAEAVEDPIFWHNQAIEIFNQMLWPIDIKSSAQ